MKKFVSLSLVALLLVALCATGVFAVALSDYPDIGVDFSSIIQSTTFFRLPTSYLNGTSSSAPALIFNGIEAYLENNYYIFLIDGVSTKPQYLTSYQYIFFTTNTSGYFVLNPRNDSTYYAFGSSLTSGNALQYTNNSYVYASDVGILFSDETSVVDPVIGESVNFSIPSGYALVVGSSSGDVEIIGRSYSIHNSWSFSILELDSPYRCNGSVQRVLALGNIRDGFSPDLNASSSILVPWTATNSNGLGSASSYSFYGEDDILLSSGSCFVITNPVYYGTGTLQNQIIRENAVDLNVNLQLQYSTRPSTRLVALESLVNISDNQFFSYYSVFRPEVYDESGTPFVDGDTTTEVFPSAPSGGGNNGQPPVNENSITGIVSRLVNDIKGFFESAVNGINELVSSGSGFMQAVGQMFSWLPQPLLLLIISGFTILFVVGVLKVLWR